MPVVDPSAWVHDSVVLIGDVIIGPGCYVGAGAVLRGDFGHSVLERESELPGQLRGAFAARLRLRLEPRAHVGHGAIVHAARIGRDALVGMNSVIMDRATVGEQAMIARDELREDRRCDSRPVLAAGVAGSGGARTRRQADCAQGLGHRPLRGTRPAQRVAR